MILLAIDTSMASCSACVYNATQNEILADERELMERGHAEALPPIVARVMAKAGTTFKDLSRIAVTTGPGTFTGIRIGISFARALGVALNIKVVGVNTMLATQLAVNNQDKPILVAHRAGASNHVYFTHSNNSINIEMLNYDNLAGTDLPLGAIFLGTAADAMMAATGRSDLERLPNFDLPRAASIAAYAAGQPEPNAMPEPLYLREADAKPQTSPHRNLPGLHIMLASHVDVALLAKLHAACFPTAWDEAAFLTLLKSPGVAAFVATSAEGPVGLLLYRVVLDEAEILTLGVDPNLRRRGAGAALLEALLALNIKTLFLEVAHRNTDAINLYSKAGFVVKGRRLAYYSETGDDALILRRDRDLA